MTRIFAVAFYDTQAVDPEIGLEVVRAEDELDACITFTKFWTHLEDICTDNDMPIPTSLSDLKDLCSANDIDVSIVEVK